MTVMLYKHPGQHNIQGDKFDYVIVNALEVADYIKKGWFKTPCEAKAAKPVKKKAEAVAEKVTEDVSEDEIIEFALENGLDSMKKLQDRATELEIPFDGRASEKSLLRKIFDKVTSE